MKLNPPICVQCVCACVHVCIHVRLIPFPFYGENGESVWGREGVHVKGEEAVSLVAKETIVLASPVIGAAGMSMSLLFLSLFNTSDTSAVTGHKHTHTQNTTQSFMLSLIFIQHLFGISV